VVAFAVLTVLMLCEVTRRLLRAQQHAFEQAQAATKSRAALANEFANARLLQVLARVGDGIMAMDAQRCISYVNATAVKLLSRDDAEQLEGRHLWTEYPGLVGSAFYQALERAMQQQQPMLEASYTTPLGREYEGRIYPSEDGVSIYFTDITERKRVDELLRLSELRYRLASARGHVWDWDVVTGQVTFSTAFWQLFDLPVPAPEDLTSVFESLLRPTDRLAWQRALRLHLTERRPYELVYRAGGGTTPWRWFRTQGQAIWDAQGRATYMAGTTFEITEQVLAESQRSLLAQRLQSQEIATGRRLAQSLHDKVGQTLAVARMTLEACIAVNAKLLPPPVLAQGEQITRLLEQAIQEVRGVLVNLRPLLLEDQGLAAALEGELCLATTTTADAEVLLEADDNCLATRWPHEVEYAAFMVAREATLNALRHAQAALVRIVLQGDATQLQLHIIDDGIGVADSLTAGRAGHLGIIGMRERCLAIDACFAIAREAGGGTRVSLRWQAPVP
jgi:signal transduction histidine kinase